MILSDYTNPTRAKLQHVNTLLDIPLQHTILDISRDKLNFGKTCTLPALGYNLKPNKLMGFIKKNQINSNGAYHENRIYAQNQARQQLQYEDSLVKEKVPLSISQFPIISDAPLISLSKRSKFTHEDPHIKHNATLQINSKQHSPQNSQFDGYSNLVNNDQYTTIQTASFNIKFINQSNKTLSQFLKNLIPSHRIKNKQVYTTIGSQNNKLIQSQSPSPKATQKTQQLSQLNKDCKVLDGNLLLTSTIKNKVVEELWRSKKEVNMDILENSKTIEEFAKLISINLLSDGSILIKPIEVEIQSKLSYVDGSEAIDKEESAHFQINKPLTEDKHLRDFENKPKVTIELPEGDVKKMNNSKNAIQIQMKMLLGEQNKSKVELKKCKDICKITQEPISTVSSKQLLSKINKIYWSYNHLETHECNKALGYLNRLVQALKFKDHSNSINEILYIIGATKICIPKLTPEALAQKDIISKIKQKFIHYFNKTINYHNSMAIQGGEINKYYIGKGNNSALIKSIFKQKPWWTLIEKDEILDANFLWTQAVNKKYTLSLPTLISTFHSSKESNPLQLANHLEFHSYISNKKSLFINLFAYYQKLNIDPYMVLPITFHIKEYDDPEMAKFIKMYNLNEANQEPNIWIIKPGEFTNRGSGITVTKSLNDIKAIIKKTEAKRTNIIQKYIDNPLLINKRKFDIRCYAMVTSINGYLKGYYYHEGYLRTSSKEFNTKNLGNKFIHLTNDAIQKNNEEYGKYETGNKLSYADMQRYMDSNYQELNIDFKRDISSQMKV